MTRGELHDEQNHFNSSHLEPITSLLPQVVGDIKYELTLFNTSIVESPGDGRSLGPHWKLIRTLLILVHCTCLRGSTRYKQAKRLQLWWLGKQDESEGV